MQSLSESTGGQPFALLPAESGQIDKLFLNNQYSNMVDILSVSDTVVTSKTYSVPVDSTVTSLTFSVSGTSNIAVTRPDGTTVPTSGIGIQSIQTNKGASISIIGPPFGTWSISVSGPSTFSLNVRGQSSLDFSSFDFVNLEGSGIHLGFFPINGLPESQNVSVLKAQLSALAISSNFELRSPAGAPMQILSLEELGWANEDPEPSFSVGPVRQFLGAVPTPGEQFRAYVTGFDINGLPYQRVISRVTKPQAIKIEAPIGQTIIPGQTMTYTFNVTNFGPTTTLKFTGADDNKFLTTVTPDVAATLGTNETRQVRVTLQLPASAFDRALDTLVLTAQSLDNLDNYDYAIVRSTVLSNRPPDVSNAQPSLATIWPPNHKMVSVAILGVTDPDNDPVTIAIDRITQDEPANGSGDGNTCPDAFGITAQAAQVRAERDGNGNGRVYTIFFTASDGRGGSTKGSVKVRVPKNANSTAIEDASSFDSTICP